MAAGNAETPACSDSCLLLHGNRGQWEFWQSPSLKHLLSHSTGRLSLHVPGVGGYPRTAFAVSRTDQSTLVRGWAPASLQSLGLTRQIDVAGEGHGGGGIASQLSRTNIQNWLPGCSVLGPDRARFTT